MDPPTNQPGFNLYADQGPHLIASMIALIILSTTFVSLRLLSRHIAHAGYWWDDVLIILALLISLAPPALNIYAVKHTGFGKHIYRLSDDDETRQADVTETLRMLWTFQLFFVLATGTIKLCILTFYRRISLASPSRCWRNVLFGMAAVVGSFTLGVLVLTIFQCTPIHAFWDADVNESGHCINPLTNLLITGSLNTVLDFIVVLLPIPLLWQLRTTTPQKAVLTAIFLSAGFVCVVSVIRLVVFSKVDMEDVTWDSSAVTLWSAVEPCAGIVGACVPSLRPLCSVGLRRVRRMRSPTLVAGSSKGGRLDSGAAMMPSVLQDVESGNTPDEDNRNGMGGKEICVFNTLCTVPSAMRRAQEKPGAVDGETQIKVEEVEIPWGGIKVKTEIRWSVQERYDYDDRLY